MSALLIQIDEKHVATLTLNRPLIHNAIDDTLIMELTNALRDLETKQQVRAVVLTSSGSSFCAGADLHWMRRMAGFSAEENLRDAEALAGLLRRLSALGKPTLAVVQGPAYGGGVGLVAACDIAVASDNAVFSLSEVRLGLIPATISPYVIGAIGVRAARRYFLTGERFTAAEAHRLGLVHEVVPPDQLQRAAERMLAALLEG
ncbi:MAG TPA: enoyl-CoA hydratase-related protein, partial [Dongiaceae bacterium]|nr:enoyl-CoA hydratase-related protein [Dongiaceae bacterium]